MTEHEAFKLFKPQIDKLKQSHNSACKDWWRSRYSDWLNFTGNMTREEWERATMLQLLWNKIWFTYRQEMIPKRLLMYKQTTLF